MYIPINLIPRVLTPETLVSFMQSILRKGRLQRRVSGLGCATPYTQLPPASLHRVALRQPAVMRGVVQRVLSGSVSVGGREISRIQRGIVVLVGISDTDTEKDLQYLCKKLLATRLWSSDDDKPWAKSVVDMGFDVLLVSQFTLYASIKSASAFLGSNSHPLSLLACLDSLPS